MVSNGHPIFKNPFRNSILWQDICLPKLSKHCCKFSPTIIINIENFQARGILQATPYCHTVCYIIKRSPKVISFVLQAVLHSWGSVVHFLCYSVLLILDLKLAAFVQTGVTQKVMVIMRNPLKLKTSEILSRNILISVDIPPKMFSFYKAGYTSWWVKCKGNRCASYLWKQ